MINTGEKETEEKNESIYYNISKLTYGPLNGELCPLDIEDFEYRIHKPFCKKYLTDRKDNVDYIHLDKATPLKHKVKPPTPLYTYYELEMY